MALSIARGRQFVKNEPNKYLVVGADGVIGGALADHLVNQGVRVVGTTRRETNLSDTRILLDFTEDLTEWQPPEDFFSAFLCVATSSLATCRKAPAASFLINVTSTIHLARKLAESGTFVVFPSTNLVFDGCVPYRRVEDPVCPITEYGHQKAEAEKQLLAMGNGVAVVRLSKVIVPGMPLLVGWRDSLREGLVIHPFDDLVFSPVTLPFITEALAKIGNLQIPGIYQISAMHDLTYAMAAKYIARKIDADIGLVQPVSSNSVGSLIEATPSYTTLDITRLREQLGLEPIDVWRAIDFGLGL